MVFNRAGIKGLRCLKPIVVFNCGIFFPAAIDTEVYGCINSKF